MKIKMSKADVTKALETYLAEHVLKEPVVVEQIEVTDRINYDWHLEIGVKPKDEALPQKGDTNGQT